MTEIRIEWERIGRNRDVPDFVHEFEDTDEGTDELSALITGAINRHTLSSSFGWVIVDDKITIDGGRYGGGTVTFKDTE